MPIIVPDTRGVDLAQQRGSAIHPADTYAPAPQGDGGISKNAEQLRSALSVLGTNIGDAAAAINAKREQEDALKIDYYADQARKELKDGAPVEAQTNPALADHSVVIRGRVNENIGFKDGDSWARAQMEKFLQTSDWNDPAKTHAFITDLKNQTAERVKGQPFYGNGYTKAVDGVANQIVQHAQAQRAELWKTEQAQGFLRDVLDKSGAATAQPNVTKGDAPEGTYWVKDSKGNQFLADSTTGEALPADKQPKTDVQTGSAIGTVVKKIIGAESGGNASITNPKSSAGGLGQFIDSTWISSVKKYAPGAVAGMSDDQILKLKTDASPTGVALQKAVLTGFTKDNAAAVAQAGAPVTAGNIYLMHFAGTGGGTKVLKAADNTPVSSVLKQDAIVANPFLRTMTVGDLKEWAAKKMNSPYDANASAQNAVRQVDREWAQSSGLSNVQRRNAIASGLVDLAQKTGDASYLDRMPPELMTPSVAADFAKARKVAADVQWSLHERERAKQTQQREEDARAALQRMNEKIERGEALTAADTRGSDGKINNAAYEYYMSHINTVNMPTAESRKNADNLADDIESAAAKGDYTKLSPDWGAKPPSLGQLREVIMGRKDIKSEDKTKLLDNVEKLMNTGGVVASPESKEYYTRTIDGYAKGIEQGIITKAINTTLTTPVNFQGEATRFYDGEVRSRVKAHIESHNGQMPQGEDKRLIFEAAGKATKEHLQDWVKMVQSGKNPDEAPKPKEGTPAPSGPIKVSEIPKDAKVVTVEGQQFAQIGNKIVKVIPDPKAETPQQPKPAEAPKSNRVVEAPFDNSKGYDLANIPFDAANAGGKLVSWLGDLLTGDPQSMIDRVKSGKMGVHPESPLGRQIIEHQEERLKAKKK